MTCRSDIDQQKRNTYTADMGFTLMNRPTRSVSGLIAVAMLLTIVSQILALVSADHGLAWASWVILLLSCLLLAYALFQLVRQRPPESSERN